MLTLVLALQTLSADEAAILGPGPVALLREGASMSAHGRDEALADALLLLALSHPPGPARRAWAEKAEPVYAVLADVRRVPESPSEPQLRRLWKRTRALFETAPEQVAGFFEIMRRRGLAPEWDADELGKSRWGWKDRLERLRLRR